MRNPRRTTELLLPLAIILIAATSFAQQRPPILEKIAKAYGLDFFGQVEAIRYTFDLNVPGLVKVKRSWEWEPKTGKVSFEGTDKDGKPVKATYMRGDLSNQSDLVKKTVDPAFVNDNYWLLFPLHAYWDTGAAVEDAPKQKLPLGKGTAEKVSVKYPAEGGGYTPGDTWELYVGPNDRVEEFVYHRAGAQKPSTVIATWAGYKKAGPLLLSTDHRGTADGKPLHLAFTNVAVKVSGSDKWMDARAIGEAPSRK
jgi:hypothetical protein